MLELYNQNVQDIQISKEEFNVIKRLLHGHHIFPKHILIKIKISLETRKL